MPVDMDREGFTMVLVPIEDDDSDEPSEVGCRDAEPAEEGDIESGWSPDGTPPIVLPNGTSWGDRLEGILGIDPPPPPPRSPDESKSFGSRSGRTSRVRVCQT
jgi:hypothetical protein